MSNDVAAPDRRQTGLRAGVSRETIAAWLLVVATVWLVFRLPGSVIACAILPLLALLVTGIHAPRRSSVWLWVFLGLAVVSSAVAVVFSPDGLPLVNFFTITGVFTVFSAALLAGGNDTRLTDAVMSALYWSFGGVLLIGLGEIVTGFRLITVLYPEASTVAINNRFLVAAFFPNYNDFAVVVTMFALMALVRFFLAPGGNLIQVLRLASYAISALVILGQGSRGALAGLFIGSILVVVQCVRLVRPRAITPLFVILGGLGAALAGALLWASPLLQDHSTQVRGDIVGNTLRLTPDGSLRFWTGWGDITSFKDAAAVAYPWELMDPHNILLEAFIWYGLPTLLSLVALWAVIVWRGVWRLEIRQDWRAMSAVILF
ncbi:MAG TPA: hypothetical protein K8V15_09925, partial [Tessaracoccus flavescens]|nr:hypothetical protein [Tessaracoccus flavescens]